jgi:4-hydroxy-tetrahydrodipicolinate synthase
MSEFSGIWIPIVTPLREDRVDRPAVRRLVERFVQAGCAGLVVGATTGEASALDQDEKSAMLDTVLEAAAGRLKVLMGVSGTDTRAMSEQARHWARLPVAGLLVTPPAYVRPSQEGCIRHFESIGAAADVPLVLYNIGYRTGVALETQTIARLALDPRVQAVKECGGDLNRLQELISLGRPAVLCGDDAWAFTALSAGASGVIAAAAHVRPDLWVSLACDLREQRLERARDQFARLLPVIRLLFAQPNPAPLKAALAMAGDIAEELRLPMLALAPAERETLGRALATLGSG